MEPKRNETTINPSSLSQLVANGSVQRENQHKNLTISLQINIFQLFFQTAHHMSAGARTVRWSLRILHICAEQKRFRCINFADRTICFSCLLVCKNSQKSGARARPMFTQMSTSSRRVATHAGGNRKSTSKAVGREAATGSVTGLNSSLWPGE